MSSDWTIKADAKHPPWTGSGGAADDRKKRQLLKLKALIHALEQGDLEFARQSFVALMNVAPHLSHDETLSKVSSALQSSHMAAAQHFVKSLALLERQWFAATSARGMRPMRQPSPPLTSAHGVFSIDFSV